MEFTITWKGYACIKKEKGCCNCDCVNCCYEPPRKIEGTKSVQSEFLAEFKCIIPKNAPCLTFHTLSDLEQKNICVSIQNKTADKETWALYFGVGNNIVK